MALSNGRVDRQRHYCGAGPAAALSVASDGVSATSNPFVLQGGPVASLQWSAIPTPEIANLPFP